MTLGGGCGIPRLRPWPANGARALLPVPDFAPHTPRHPRQLPTFFSPFFRNFLSFLGIFFCFSKDNPTHAWCNHTYLGACFTVCWDGTTEQERKKSEILFESVLLSCLLHLSPTLFTKAAARRGCSIRISSAQCLPSEAASVIQADAIAFPLERC